MEFFKPGRVFDFMGQRRFWIPLSFILVIASVILSFYPGPNYGTDFRGGTEIEVAFTKTIDTAAIRKAVEESHFSSPEVVKIIDANNPNRLNVLYSPILMGQLRIFAVLFQFRLQPTPTFS